MTRPFTRLFFFVWLLSSPAFAELGEDAAQLQKSWAHHGEVVRLPPRLAERTQPTVIFLPPDLLSGSARGCLSVAILGTSSTHFAVSPASGRPESPEDWPQSSLGGLVEVTRCGRHRARLGALLVEMRSPRAVLETVAVAATETVPRAVDLLPRRDPGPIAPLALTRAGAPPRPIEERLSELETRLGVDGGEDVRRERLPEPPRGAGSIHRTLAAGCHRWILAADPPNPPAESYALTAAVEPGAGISTPSIERGPGLEVSLDLCAGESTPVTVHFVGAPSGGSLWLVSAQFALPDGLPPEWEPIARARFAGLLRHHSARVHGTPVNQALGVQGPTPMPLALEPGACYVAALIALRGRPLLLALAASIGGSGPVQNHSSPDDDGTLISFCATGDEPTLIEADSRGSGLFWKLSLWQSGRVAVGGEGLP